MFHRLAACLMLATLLVPPMLMAADQPHLDDTNTQPDAPVVPGNFPKVMLTETQSLLASDEAWSKYDAIGGKAGMAEKVARAQAINPDVQFHFSFHPRSYLGYIHNRPCEIALGIPFNRTGARTSDCSIYAGHWLYRAGTTLAANVSSTSRTLRVRDAGTLQPGEFLVIYDAPLGSFRNAEHARVVSVDRSASPHRVELAARGFKSEAASHSQGSIVAMHERGRGNDPQNWAYNLINNSPRDASNRTISQVIADWIPDNMRLNSRGQLTRVRVDGVYFDEDGKFLFAQRTDANNDGIVDNGILPNGRNIWGEGLENFYQLVRNRLPNLRVVGGWRESFGFPSLNGTQMENWLVTDGDFDPVPTYDGNGGALSQLQNFNIHTQYHRTNEGYVEALSKNPTRLYPGSVRSGPNPVVPANNSTFRFGFGAALLADGYYGRQNSDIHPDPWYDEYAVDTTPGSSTYGHAIDSNSNDERLIRENKGWLGRPLGPRVRIYNNNQFAPSRSLIDNGSFEQGLQGWQLRNLNAVIDDSNARQGTQSLRVQGHQNYALALGNASVRGPLISMEAGRSYTLSFAARASEFRKLFVRLDFSRNQGAFILPNRWTRYVYTITATTTGNFRPIFNLGREDSTVWIDDVHVHEGNPNVFRRDFENGIVVVNATPNARTVALGGTFSRIRGTGQDSVNSGAQLSSVALPAYDAAILVRPEGADTGPAPTPGAGGECGAPAINDRGPAAIYGWADSCVSGLYHVQGTANGDYRNYVGSLESSANISDFGGDQLENSDTLERTQATSLAFDLDVYAGSDALSLQTQPDADVCLNLTVGADLLRVGESAQPAGSGVNLRTGGSCSCTSQPPPANANTSNPGLYVWYDACSETFTVRGTSNGPLRDFSGAITATENLTIAGLDSIEGHDTITGDGSRALEFELRIWRGEDEFRFSAPSNANVCLAVEGNSTGPVFYGPAAQSVSGRVDLKTGNACR